MVRSKIVGRALRRQLRRVGAQLRYPLQPMSRQPWLFGNSFPKSGTHLLLQILAGFEALGPAVYGGQPPILTYEVRTGHQRPMSDILADLKRLRPGDVAYGHLHALPEVVEQLRSSNGAAYFVNRDPRDVVVSHVFYVTEINPRHVHHKHYANELTSFDQRLDASILGRPDFVEPFPDVRARFEPYMGWLDVPEVLLVRYEDVLANQQDELGRIFDHAIARGFRTRLSRKEAIVQLAAYIKPENSPTFRSGGSGGWKKHFTPAHKKLFKTVTGDLLQRLGYEKDQNW